MAQLRLTSRTVKPASRPGPCPWKGTRPVPVPRLACRASDEDVKQLFPENRETVDQDFFKNKIYREAKAKGVQVPWDLGREQDSLKIVAGDFTGRVLDAGCGLGNNSLWLGSLPAVTSVDAVDFSVDAIQEARARQAAAPKEAASKVTFTVADINNLPFNKGQPFDCLLDSAVFHCIGDDDAQKRYLAAVTPFIKLGGKAVMLVFSDKNPDPWFGPRRISQEHATKVWTAAGWRVNRITEATMHSNIPQLNAGILMQATRVA